MATKEERKAELVEALVGGEKPAKKKAAPKKKASKKKSEEKSEDSE